jgi:malate dehydrogenase (oxaloacetate-decarboxylating)
MCIGTQGEEEIIRTVKTLEPSFGGINLEDISQQGYAAQRLSRH